MFDKPSVKEYQEPAAETDFEAFAAVVESRRSVRRFHDEAIPDAVVERCLELALLAPTSSNLQSWEFYRVVDPEKKKALADDIKDVFAELKGRGFDTKAVRQILRIRKQDRATRQEEEAILELYMNAPGVR